MSTEAGEYIVGAYLQLRCDCLFITYNARLPGGGVEGLNELDVVGINPTSRIAYLCEVTTHLHGMRPKTAQKQVLKHKRQRVYAERMLAGFSIRYQLWCPRVARAELKILQAVDGLELIVNKDYTARIEELRALARKSKYDTGNPVFRVMQILEQLR
jgi:hypothetical protein